MSATPDTDEGYATYLAMERAHYAALVEASHYDSEEFAAVNDREQVVGSYAAHESFPYESWLLGGITRRPGAVALDYGCGPGRMLKRLAPFFARVDGVDLSPELIAVAARRTAALASPPRLWTTPGDGAPEETAGAYDLAFSVICLQHIAVHALRFKILESLTRALKPGGVLSFQMGYGPGHPNMVDYEANAVDARGTNGVADVGVLHPGEIAEDLARLGFSRGAYALTPTGPGDRHGAWIFVRAVKPGTGALLAHTDPGCWTGYGFRRLTVDAAAVATARHAQRVHGVLGRRRQLHHRVMALEAAQRGAAPASGVSVQ